MPDPQLRRSAILRLATVNSRGSRRQTEKGEGGGDIVDHGADQLMRAKFQAHHVQVVVNGKFCSYSNTGCPRPWKARPMERHRRHAAVHLPPKQGHSRCWIGTVPPHAGKSCGYAVDPGVAGGLLNDHILHRA